MRKKNTNAKAKISSARTESASVVEARNHLVKAEALIGCMTFGLLYGGTQENIETADFSILAEMARTLIAAALDKLDSSITQSV